MMNQAPAGFEIGRDHHGGGLSSSSSRVHVVDQQPNPQALQNNHANAPAYSVSDALALQG